MALPNIFSNEVTATLIERINQLTPETKPLWGKMTVAQMLAHCAIPYRYVYEPQKFTKPNFLLGWVLKTFVKKGVTNEVPYKKNTGTAPDFIIKDDRDFAKEKEQLIQYLEMVQKEGATAFDGRTSFSFGVLTLEEWNNMFYKHLNHHLTQFGV